MTKPILALILLNIFILSCCQSANDLSLPPNSFSPTNIFHVFYEFSPPGNITIAIQFDVPNQYFGLGLGTGMVGADIWEFEFINGKFTVSDTHGVGFTQPVLDTASGGQNNLQVLGTNLTSTGSFVKFTRALNTNDTQNDKVIQPGMTDFIWATVPGSPVTAFHGPNCGWLQVNLVATPPVSSAGETELGMSEEEALVSEEGQVGENSEMPMVTELKALEVGEGLALIL